MKNQFFAFGTIALSSIGLIGGIGYCLYGGAPVIAVGLVAATYAAWPRLRECYKVIVGDED